MSSKDISGGVSDAQQVENYSSGEVVHQPRSLKQRLCGAFVPFILAPVTRRQKFVCAAFWLLVVALFLFVLLWLIPKIVVHGIVPLTKKLDRALTKVEIGLVLLGSVIIPPLVFVPFYPFVWLCAPILPFWPCFAIVEFGSTVGMLVSYYLAKTVMRSTAQKWADNNVTMRAVFTALDRVGPFKTVLLLRITPLPYAIINYCSSVPPNLSVYTFMAASTVGLLPRHLLWVYFGRNLKGLVDFLQGKPMPTMQIVYYVVALVVAVVVIIGGAITARVSLRNIRGEQHKADAEAAAADEEAQASVAGTDASAGVAFGLAPDSTSSTSSDVRDTNAALSTAAERI